MGPAAASSPPWIGSVSLVLPEFVSRSAAVIAIPTSAQVSAPSGDRAVAFLNAVSQRYESFPSRRRWQESALAEEDIRSGHRLAAAP